MLVQRRPGGRIRLVEQHEHGLVSGELAAGWHPPSSGSTLSPSLILATSLHDLGWQKLDRGIRFNAETGLPHDFLTFPPAEKYRAAAEGIERVAELHPYSGVLVSLHYTELGKVNAPPEFLEEEAQRRLELLDALGDAQPPMDEVRNDLAHLQLFDHLSLFLCLASPDAVADSLPEWLARGRFRGVDTRGPLTARWTSSDHVVLDPFPFAGEELALEVTCRDLDGAPFSSGDELEAAWKEAEPTIWKVRIGSGRAAGT